MPAEVEKSSAILTKALEILPSSEEEVILSGVVSKIMERIVELKTSKKKLIKRYKSIEKLKERIDKEGVSTEDHTLYNDLLEWRAIKHELEELTSLLETV